MVEQERQELVADRLAVARWEPREDIVASIQLLQNLQLLVLENDVLCSQAGKRVGHSRSELGHLLHMNTKKVEVSQATPITSHTAGRLSSIRSTDIVRWNTNNLQHKYPTVSVRKRIPQNLGNVGACACSRYQAFSLLPLEGLGTRLV